MGIPQITVTPAGFAAIVNAENTGTAPVKITQVGLSSTAFDASSVGTSLPGQIKRLATFGGKAVAKDTLHINVRDDGQDTYTVRGLALFLADGTLFAAYSQTSPIMEKAAAATLLLATDIRFANINATSIEAGPIDFINPPATESQVGVVRLASEQESILGSSRETALTPRGGVQMLDARLGKGAPSDFFKGLMTAATAAMLRVAIGVKSAALRDEGHGNALDADMLDGSHGAYYLDARNHTNKPSSYPAAPHEHPMTQVTGLVDALAGKFSTNGGTVNGPVSVNGNALRSYNWGGKADQGVILLGSGNSSIFKHGDVFDFTAEGAFNATLDSGGTIWTSGNFNPGAKSNVGHGHAIGEVQGLNDALNDRVRCAYGGYLDADANSVLSYSMGSMAHPSVNTTNGSWNQILSNVTTGRDYGFQISGPWFGEDLFMRKVQTSVWQPWRRLWHDGNFNPATKADQAHNHTTAQIDGLDAALSSKFDKSGGEISGPVRISGFAGDPRHGVVYLGGGSSYMEVRNGTWLLYNEATGEGTVIRGGGETWTSGNFDPASKFDKAGGRIQGNVSAGGVIEADGGFNFGSSRKLKDIDGPMPYGLEEVRRISTMIGKYKPDYNADGRTRLFFDAEQFMEVMPEAVDSEGVSFNGELVPAMKLDQTIPPAYRAIAQIADWLERLEREVVELREGR